VLRLLVSDILVGEAEVSDRGCLVGGVDNRLNGLADRRDLVNPRFNLGATRAARLYFATTVTTVTLSDLMNSRTNELFTVKEWRHWIRKLDREYLERRVDASFTNRQAHKIFRMTRKISPHVVEALNEPMQVSHPLDGNIYALKSSPTKTTPPP
jgi:hypothetical protein